jgi:hypothetical protein
MSSAPTTRITSTGDIHEVYDANVESYVRGATHDTARCLVLGSRSSGLFVR